ncbi:MAG: DUF2628 domain-containing protein [Moraxella sp.]|nr:DUF2628 domain-containing protein [Moraxella sp.]
MFRLPFLEDTTPPPFYLPHLSDKERTQLDKWFIGHRSQSYYLKRFRQFDEAGKLHGRWHWSAFVATFGWLMYRKRYLDCLVYCIAGWSFIKLNVVIILAMCEFLFVGRLPDAHQMYVRLAIGVAVWLFWAGMVARWADAYYYRMARREIADAVQMYPFDKEAQKTHLTQHGQTSLLGLATAFGIFGAILGIIALQFVPLIAMQKEQQTIYESYRMASSVKQRVAQIYQTTGSCPVGLPVGADHQKVSLEVVGQVAGRDSDCAVVATISGATYPVRYLNGRNLVMYHTKNPDGTSLWRCQTSLNKAQAPKRCL